MRRLTKVASAASLFALLGSVQAASVTCPTAFNLMLTRAVTVSGALALNAGGECHYKDGNINGDNASVFPTMSIPTPTLIEKDVASGGGGTGALRYTITGTQLDPRTQGTWAMGSNLWAQYSEIFIAFHFGGGQGSPDSFFIELDKTTPWATGGTWALTGTDRPLNGLSNIYLFGRGTGGGGANGNGNGVPEPATLALVGLGLLGAAAARRRRV